MKLRCLTALSLALTTLMILPSAQARPKPPSFDEALKRLAKEKDAIQIGILLRHVQKGRRGPPARDRLDTVTVLWDVLERQMAVLAANDGRGGPRPENERDNARTIIRFLSGRAGNGDKDLRRLIGPTLSGKSSAQMVYPCLALLQLFGSPTPAELEAIKKLLAQGLVPEHTKPEALKLLLLSGAACDELPPLLRDSLLLKRQGASKDANEYVHQEVATALLDALTQHAEQRDGLYAQAEALDAVVASVPLEGAKAMIRITLAACRAYLKDDVAEMARAFSLVMAALRADERLRQTPVLRALFAYIELRRPPEAVEWLSPYITEPFDAVDAGYMKNNAFPSLDLVQSPVAAGLIAAGLRNQDDIVFRGAAHYCSRVRDNAHFKPILEDLYQALERTVETPGRDTRPLEVLAETIARVDGDSPRARKALAGALATLAPGSRAAQDLKKAMESGK